MVLSEVVVIISEVLIPPSQGTPQNYWKYIDISLHTGKFERLAAAAGMASCQDMVETSLIGGNALRITT